MRCSPNLHLVSPYEMELAEDGQAGMGVARKVKMTGKRQLNMAIVDRAQVLHKT